MYCAVTFRASLMFNTSSSHGQSTRHGLHGDFGDKLQGGGTIKALVDRLSSELSSRYQHYLEVFHVGLWSDVGSIEFRCSFALHDEDPRDFTIKVPAVAGDTDGERQLLIVMVFEEIEHMIDMAIAERQVEMN